MKGQSDYTNSQTSPLYGRHQSATYSNGDLCHSLELFDVQYSCRDTGIKICRHFWKLDMCLGASTVKLKIDLSRASQRWWCVAEIDHRQNLSIEISVFVSLKTV